ncbi:MAG: NAD(P)/FAD-dependent oxidoreductase [Tibeticola sp.]
MGARASVTPYAPAVTTRRRLLGAAAWVPLAAAAPLAGCSGAGGGREIAGGFAGVAVERGHRLRDAASIPMTPARTHRVQVLIAGGGIAGLAAARALRQRGIDDFRVLELEDAPGGNSRGLRLAGLPCPLGAHYLPVPGSAAHEVQDWLEELGLRQRVAGRWTYDERALCHSPQERLFFQGSWQDGLLPMQGVGAGTLAQFRRFGQRIAALQQQARFTLPAARAPWSALHRALDAVSFDAWLAREGFDDPHLRWYLDYCCRDDYGAGSATVSAWAGVHYFASRHGFHAPGDDPGGEEADGVLTWPEGNGWLARQLAAPLGERLLAGRVVLRIEQERHGVSVDAWNVQTQDLERWRCAHCIVALPSFVAARVVANPPHWLRAVARAQPHASWVVVNLALDAPLHDRPGAAPSWDNVVYGSTALGYVDAGHQRLHPVPVGPTVLTWYHALGAQRAAREALLRLPWTHWRDAALADLAEPHPDLPARTTQVAVTRHGHAMAVPVPGILNLLGQTPAPTGRILLSINDSTAPLAPPRDARLSFAHADWSGYSVFEEAFTRGHGAGRLA